MSTEEDVELKDLVTQTLELNGCLPKIRAELRASIFLALEEETEKEEHLLNKKITSQLESREGKIMFCLVREFLEYFNLNFTISVYEPESYMGNNYQYEGRKKIIEDLGISQLKQESKLPLLLQLIQIAQLKNESNNIDVDLNKLQKGEEYSHSEISEVEQFSTNESLQDESSNRVPVLNLNETFKVNSPIVKFDQGDENLKIKLPTHNQLDLPKRIQEKEECSELSSVSEESAADLDKSSQSYEKSHSVSEIDFSPPILKESKSFDKIKLSSPKTEKLKTKSSLTSLADLPPLQLNKPRNDTLLLPSLYSKEFKDKTLNQNLKDIDRFFDVGLSSLDNYEEDFMSDSEVNLSKTSDTKSKADLLKVNSSRSVSSLDEKDVNKNSSTSLADGDDKNEETTSNGNGDDNIISSHSS